MPELGSMSCPDGGSPWLLNHLLFDPSREIGRQPLCHVAHKRNVVVDAKGAEYRHRLKPRTSTSRKGQNWQLAHLMPLLIRLNDLVP